MFFFIFPRQPFLKQFYYLVPPATTKKETGPGKGNKHLTDLFFFFF
jgi:hypothetical protein